MQPERRAEVTRRTKESEVSVRLVLDGRARALVRTGIGLLDHLLESLAVHAGFDLELRAEGDLHVDPHHTMEDVAIVLGQALAQALASGPRPERFGDATVPMDESLASAAVDCSGRGVAVLNLDLPGPGDDGVPSSLFEHFLDSLARSSGVNLHLAAGGRDRHHVLEATFKALARALRQAVRVDEGPGPRRTSTKELP